MSEPTFAALADVLAPQHSQSAPPVSLRAPAQVEDIAFAETVSARELTDDAPPSTPIFFDNPRTASQCVTPLAFPLPPPADDVDLRTRLRVGTAHVRHGLRGSIEEMSDLWRGAGEIVESELIDGVRLPPATQLGMLWRRLGAAWSCFTWTGGDLARAALIGSGVLLVTATAFVSTLPSDDDAVTAASSSTEVRAARTLEQHTGRRVVVRAKLERR